MKTNQLTSYQNDMATIQLYLEHYNVTEDGKILRLFTRSGRKYKTPKEVGSINTKGYISVGLTCGSASSLWKTKAHRLVALIYVHNPKPNEYNFVNHKNGIKTDNRADNLEWCTLAENTQHAYDTGAIKVARGEEAGKSKLTEEQVLAIRAEYIPKVITYQMLADKYGIATRNIQRIIQRHAWTHI